MSNSGQPLPAQDRPRPPKGRRASWISHGLESLQQGLQARRDARLGKPDFDVLVVGSGYGGAIAADRLAGCSVANEPLSIAVLERGREHLAGSFPDRAADLAGHVRFTTPHGEKANGRLEGLFDMRLGADVSVLVANGVGGGSLINAGVMAFPLDEVFEEPAWPSGLRGQGAMLRERAGNLERELRPKPAVDAVRPRLERFKSMQALGARAVPITVALDDGCNTVANVKLERCVACGDCATGCNQGAKASLDLGLLRRAQTRGAEIFAGATVTRLARKRDLWELDVWHTDAALRKRMAGPLKITARRVVLAAGTLGSTEILMRSLSPTLSLSPALGRHFSANGDLLATVLAEKAEFNGVADEVMSPKNKRAVGPTIMSMIDRRQKQGFVVQDLGIPGALARLFEEGLATASLFQQLDKADKTEHLGTGHPDAANKPDPMAVNPQQVRRALAVALIARDDAAGMMTAAPQDEDMPLDAGVRIDWRELRNDKRFDEAHVAFQKELGDQYRLLPNPMWRLLSPEVEQMLGAGRGPLLSVHPLGGCRMAEDRLTGVVDRDGRVFDGRKADVKAVHDGLVVLDGAIVPGSLGINPALTIATLADLAVERLIDQHWTLVRPANPVDPPSADVPRFAVRGERPIPRRTEVQVIEKLAGPVDLEGEALWMELALVYEPRALYPPKDPAHDDGSRPAFTQAGHRLPVAVHPQLSRVRLFRRTDNESMPEEAGDEHALLIMPVAAGSHLQFFHREESTAKQRRCRAWRAWWSNRGARDSVIAFFDGLRSRSGQSFNVCRRLRQSLNLATRAGEVRLFDYSIKLGAATIAPLNPERAGDKQRLELAQRLSSQLAGQTELVLEGSKRFTYERRANPWTQLMRMELTHFAGLRLGGKRSIDVRPDYFARQQMPLLRVVQQENQPAAMIDMLAFGLYLARVFVNVHLWSGRKPDVDYAARAPARLPRSLPCIPAEPQVHEFVPDGASNGCIRLTRYPLPKSEKPPVLLIHGYSASGTTFAHPSLKPSLAECLWRQGREPWVLDLRTSCGMPTAEHGYSFEQIARADIPAAFREVCARTGHAQVDVVSHCMGSVMLAMTLRDQSQPHAAATAARMRRWVMSQFGPVMRFSPANLLRAYLMSWFRHLLPDYRYSLRPGDAAVGVDGSMYDRLVATIPYLNDERGLEFDIENPRLPWRRVPWVGTRHRLDALIGRTFDSRNMDSAVLEHIDDFFGPLNLATLSQPIYFAQYGEPADRTGRSVFGDDPSRLLARVPMLSLHGRTNGLADPDNSANLLQSWALEKGLNLQSESFDGMGHQDLLIGNQRCRVFKRIGAFFE